MDWKLDGIDIGERNFEFAVKKLLLHRLRTYFILISHISSITNALEFITMALEIYKST